MAWLFHKHVPSAVISYCIQELCAHLQLHTLLPCLYSVCSMFLILRSSSSFQALRKKIIKECCERFWGCPVQRQELDSVVLVGHFQLMIFCDSNMVSKGGNY